MENITVNKELYLAYLNELLRLNEKERKKFKTFSNKYIACDLLETSVRVELFRISLI